MSYLSDNFNVSYLYMLASNEHNTNAFLLAIQIYLSELLNYPVVHRCAELNLLINRCSIKELQDFFPVLVQSVFGNASGGNQLGWGLRTLTAKTNNHEYEVMYSFFMPMGPMFRLCYRLLNEPIKFDVPIEILPVRFRFI